MEKKEYIGARTRVIAEGAVAVALSVILKDILPPIIRLPQGGSVSAAGMVPLFCFSLRHGLHAGLEISFVYGLVHMALGGYMVNPIQAILDYPLAYAALGLSGLFRKYPVVGVGTGILGRFICHFVSGILLFAIYAPEGMNPTLYSAIYNGSYLAVEFIISSLIIYILVRKFPIK
ncbi:MAG: energy-coupled thiamine transporter ThiT [Candidatus Bathyarchaeia archaeon]